MEGEMGVEGACVMWCGCVVWGVVYCSLSTGRGRTRRVCYASAASCLRPASDTSASRLRLPPAPWPASAFASASASASASA